MFSLISLAVLFSCTNAKREKLKANESKTKVISSPQVFTAEKPNSDSVKSKKHEDAVSSINYAFYNDTLCQTLTIKKISASKRRRMPEKLEFKLLLHDKHHNYDDKIFDGIAQLSSSSESFSDNLDKDGGDYFAADYEFDGADYNIQIRLDIKNYEACVVQITTNQPDKVLGGYRAYVKKFPDDGVMKRGECK